MSQLDATAIAEKWRRNVVAGIPSYKAGIEAVTISPMERAAAAKDLYVKGVTEAAESGKWEAGLRSVSLETWKSRATGAGAERIARGVADAMPKMQNFLSQLIPYTQKVSQVCRSMPKGTLEDSIARATEAIRMMKEFRASKRRM